MPFPEFDPAKKKILFFSRGRGRGHAVPDIEIIRALNELRPDVEIRIVSYGAGAATFAEFDYPLIDVGLPDTSPIVEMSVLAGRLIGWLNPDLVVAHEEFAVMPAAKIFDKASVFITDWFTEPDMYSMNALKFADEIVFTGRQGVFEEPPWVRGKIRYVGPVLRQFSYGRADRLRARAELGIAADALVVSVFPGSWTEAETPVLDLVIGAFETGRDGARRLIWVAGTDAALIGERLAGRDYALVFDRCWEIDRLMAATDVAITKTNRTTIFELHHLGVPTIAVSFGLNPIDDQAVSGLVGVLRLPAEGLTSEALAAAMGNLAATPVTRTATTDAVNAAQACARLLSEVLDRGAR